MNPKFFFPFKPYAIQEKFMKELYLTIEENKLGIFESPTGTGKSLSISCGALQWLKDNNKKNFKSLEEELNKLKLEVSCKPSTEDWLQEEYEKVKKKQTIFTLQNRLDKIKKQNEMFDEIRVRVAKMKLNHEKKTVLFNFSKREKNNINESFVDKETTIEYNECEEDKDILLEETEKEDDCESGGEEIEKDQEDDEIVKIYISSRTHSQLSQFVGEIKKTVFKDNTRVVTLASRQHYCINSDVKRLKNVNLINERCLDMQKSNTKSTSVGEDGKVVKKIKTNTCVACPYYNQGNITKLKERILVDIMDVEELVSSAKELKACPYYASRMALDDAEVICISHAGIVSAGARAGVSLKLKNNILILDEAHGLTAALESAHSAPLAAKQLSSVKTYLQFYINKYRARLSSRNLLMLNQISFVVGKLLGFIVVKMHTEKQSDDTTVFTLEDFVIKSEIDHLNLRPLVEFCRNTRLARKLHGFSLRYSQQALDEEMTKSTVDKKSSFESFLQNISKKKPLEPSNEIKPELKQNVQSPPFETSAGSGLYAVLDFLEMLCDRSENGRVLVQRGPEQSGHLKYLLLNPAEHFADVIKQCRSVIVAGGTMEPISEFRSLLGVDSASHDAHSSSHNAHSASHDAHSASHDAHSASHDAHSASHGSHSAFHDAQTASHDAHTASHDGHCASHNAHSASHDARNVRVVRCEHVVPPDHVLAVCLSRGPANLALNFSYENRMAGDLLNEVGRILRNICNIVPGGVVCFLPSYSYEKTVFDHLTNTKTIDAISKKKTIFREPKSAGEVDQVLTKFATAVKNKDSGKNGALLLSVVGGKLSEGLNFSDELGRCVIVVGMPYPNVKSPELQEKMAYLNRTAGAGAGSVYYENLCMKAVNQCIGRAVRHANDYACVLLVDERYSRPQTISALPSFVQKSLLANCNFGPTIGSIAKFFSKHKSC